MKLPILQQAGTKISHARPRHVSHLAPLLLALAVSQAYAAPLPGINVTKTESANGPGAVTAHAVANGGAGEAGTQHEEIGETGAVGGTALAQASGLTQGTASATVLAEAFGGNGGDQGLGWYNNGNYLGGKGGDASASATGQSGSGMVSVTARATGGNGGAGYTTDLSGNGGGVALVNAVSGTTSGVLTLSQEAQGGTAVRGGGIHDYDQQRGANGGNAASNLTLSDAGASAVKANVSAIGGYGLNGGSGSGALTLSSTRVGASLEGTVVGKGGSSYNGKSGAGSSILVLQGSGDVLGRSTAIGGNDELSGYSIGGGATSSVNAVGAGVVDARAVATGGNNLSIFGGAASSDAFAQSSGGPVYVSATAFGGNGYEGGSATASARGVSTGGGAVTALAYARGGNFNDEYDWLTNYANASLTNAVSGSTSGLLTLTQTAEAGFGGNAYSALTLADNLASGIDVTVKARGGDIANKTPGSANASLTLSSTVQGAAVSGTAIAIGGRSSGRSGASTSLAQTSALGAATSISRSESGYASYGDASAVARATSNSAANASATSLGGASGTATASSRTLLAGGGSTARAVVSATGYANANASATGVGAALITAVANGSGTSGIVQASSGASGSGLRVAAVATAPLFGSAQAESSANVGGVSYALPSLSGAQVISNVSGITDGGTAILPAGGPLAALSGTLIGSGVHAASYAAEASGHIATYVTSGEFQFSAAADQHLLLGFLGAASLNAGFDLLNLKISNNGMALFSRSFSTLDEANLFFNASVLDLGLLGAGLQDVTVTSELTASSANGYAFSYVIGSGLLTAVPEPSTWMLLLLGATVLLVTRRRATTEGAA